MAINQVVAPDTAPGTLADWTKVNNIFQVVALMILGSVKLQSGVLKKGSAVCHGGTWYVCNTDTTPSGTSSEYIKLVKSGDGLTLTASFVADLTGVTFSTTWNHWVNVTGDYIIFDELRAYGAGLIPYPSTLVNWKPRSVTIARMLAKTESENVTFDDKHVTAGKFIAGSGDNTNNGYSFSGEYPGPLDTGMFSNGDGSLRFYTNGVDAGGPITGTTYWEIDTDNSLNWCGVNGYTGSAGTYGEVSIGALNIWTIPAGLYMMTVPSDVKLGIYRAFGYWETGDAGCNGMVISDGANFRLQNIAITAKTVYYRKLA